MGKLITFLLFLIILLCAISCTERYENIKFKNTDGLVIKIDSSKYEPVLLYDKGEQIFIASKDGIKEVSIYDGVDCVIIGLFIGFLIGALLSFLTKD